MAVENPFASVYAGHGSPFTNGHAVTKSDSVPLEKVPRTLYCGGAGNLVVKLQNGLQLTLAVQDGTYHDIACEYVMAATTATSIVALW